MKRPYNKVSPYWNEIKRKPEQVTSQIPVSGGISHEMPQIKYEFAGENIYAAAAGSGAVTNTRGKGTNSIYFNGSGLNSFENINAFPLPYEISNGRITMGKTIQLIMRAYAGFPVFRNAIEVLVEFTNTPIHLKGGNAKSRAFTRAFFDKIAVERFSEQWFREWFRSGNVFCYRFDGRLRDADFQRMKEVMAAKSNIIPIRYVIINPTSVFVENAVVTNRYTYVKLLSPFEIQRLKHPQTEEEREMFDSLPESVKTQIKNGNGTREIYIPIDPDRLYYSFYKKQDYEPLATPMGFGVLNDIEHKLQLKRIDMALTKTIEHAFLMITMGNEPEKHGISQTNLATMQELFKNSTIGRVLVSDYTTKAEWVIPDFKELLGPEKYEVVDKDIREGLQSILIGEDKFANAVIKARVFNERLKDGRNAFAHFMNAEIRRICGEMNFKSVPTIEFEELSLEDETNLQRLYTRWAELGILSPWELMRAQKTGLLPDKVDNVESQKEYKTLRDQEYYYPLVGASSPKNEEGAAGDSSGGNGRPSGTSSPQTTKTVSPIGGGVNADKLKEAVLAAESLKSSVVKSFRKKFKIKKLDDATNSLVGSIYRSIMVNEPIEKWNESVLAYLENPKDIDKTISATLDEIQILHDVDEDKAILLHKCKIQK